MNLTLLSFLHQQVEAEGLKMIYCHQVLEGPLSDKASNYGIYIAGLLRFLLFPS